MGKIALHPPSKLDDNRASISPLPGVLQTPSGLAILEIQGTIKSTFADESSLLDGKSAQSIGRLAFPLYDSSKASGDISWHKRIHLYVGDNQRLTGELKKIPQPIAVLRRRQPLSQSQAQESEVLEIAEIIHYRILFNQRPEPVGSALSEQP